MIDLHKISGLPILFDEQKLDLVFSGDFPFIKKSERSLEELKPYLKNSGVDKGSDPVYYVWRHVYLKENSEKIKVANLRYDITLMPPGTIDNEFAKTAGHFHLNKLGTDLPYPEVYEVLFGRAYFLIQSPEKNVKNIKEVRLIEAGPGEKVLVPPQFPGHTTINAFSEPLIMANWISDQAIYDYDSYKNNHGASYYILENNDLADVTKNPNYNSVPEIQKINASDISWPIEFSSIKNRPLYSLVNDIEKLKFLNYPEEFAGEWAKSE